MTHEDMIYLVLPLHHVYAGVAAFLYTLISGMRICLGSFSPDICLADFRELSPSVFICVPLLAERLLESALSCAEPLPAAFGGRVKYFYCGGTAIRPELKSRYIEAGIPFLEAYGLSETCSVAALDVVGAYRDGSTGLLMESLDARLHEPDESGAGELWLRGGSVMQGYYGMPEETARVLDEDGFFHTGDIVRIDEDRYLYVCGRRRPMLLTSNGKNVYPQELEERLCRHPQICRATLYVEGDRLHLKVWYTGDAEAVRRFLAETRERLPKYMRYQDYECLEDTFGGRIK